jgi:hypothetical protein
MKTLRLRWILPVGHLMIDLILAGALIREGRDAFRNEKARLQPSQFRNAAYLQEASLAIGFDGRYNCWPQPDAYRMIVYGSFPASIVPSLVIPQWGGTRSQLLNWEWFASNEICALIYWLTIGMLFETRLPQLRRIALVFLGIRFAALLALPTQHFGPGLVGLFWFALLMWGIVAAIVWLFR